MPPAASLTTYSMSSFLRLCCFRLRTSLCDFMHPFPTASVLDDVQPRTTPTALILFSILVVNSVSVQNLPDRSCFIMYEFWQDRLSWMRYCVCSLFLNFQLDYTNVCQVHRTANKFTLKCTTDSLFFFFFLLQLSAVVHQQNLSALHHRLAGRARNSLHYASPRYKLTQEISAY